MIRGGGRRHCSGWKAEFFFGRDFQCSYRGVDEAEVHQGDSLVHQDVPLPRLVQFHVAGGPSKVVLVAGVGRKRSTGRTCLRVKSRGTKSGARLPRAQDATTHETLGMSLSHVFQVVHPGGEGHEETVVNKVPQRSCCADVGNVHPPHLVSHNIDHGGCSCQKQIVKPYALQ